MVCIIKIISLCVYENFRNFEISSFSLSTIHLQLIFLCVLKTFEPAPLSPPHQIPHPWSQARGAWVVKLDRWSEWVLEDQVPLGQSKAGDQNPGWVQGTTQVMEICLLRRCPEAAWNSKPTNPGGIQVRNGSKLLLLCAHKPMLKRLQSAPSLFKGCTSPPGLRCFYVACSLPFSRHCQVQPEM